MLGFGKMFMGSHSMDSFVRVTLEQQVGRITLHRPDKRNALSRGFIEQLLAAVKTISAEDGLRLLILDATGPAFCAGMDLAEMRQRAESETAHDEWQEDARVFAQLLVTIYELSTPTIAIVQGPAIAGGMGLVLACDLVLVSGQAFFALPEPVRGITASIVTPLLIHRVGVGSATQLLLSGQRWTASQAMAAGMCLDVVNPDRLKSRAAELTASILQGAKSALAITKKQIASCAGEQGMDRVAAQLHTAVQVSAESRRTQDAKEGLDAFLEKRKPAWQA